MKIPFWDWYCGVSIQYSMVILQQTSLTDGTIEITATCTTCDGIEYSIDGVNFFSSGLFTDVAVGSYTITVQDAADNTCQDMSMTTIGTAADTEDPVPGLLKL